MPLIRRLPKHGFTNIFRQECAIVNLKALAELGPIDQITPQVMVEAGLIKRNSGPVKVLGDGEVTRPIVVQAHKFSRSAADKIRAAGGRAEVIGV
jgi:large subunit ribosomal protein L15